MGRDVVEGHRRLDVFFRSDKSPDVSGLEVEVWPNGRGFVVLHRRAGHPLSMPIPWKEGDRWTITEESE